MKVGGQVTTTDLLGLEHALYSASLVASLGILGSLCTKFTGIFARKQGKSMKTTGVKTFLFNYGTNILAGIALLPKARSHMSLAFVWSDIPFERLPSEAGS